MTTDGTFRSSEVAAAKLIVKASEKLGREVPLTVRMLAQSTGIPHSPTVEAPAPDLVASPVDVASLERLDSFAPVAVLRVGQVDVPFAVDTGQRRSAFGNREWFVSNGLVQPASPEELVAMTLAVGGRIDWVRIQSVQLQGRVVLRDGATKQFTLPVELVHDWASSPFGQLTHFVGIIGREGLAQMGLGLEVTTSSADRPAPYGPSGDLHE